MKPITVIKLANLAEDRRHLVVEIKCKKTDAKYQVLGVTDFRGDNVIRFKCMNTNQKASAPAGYFTDFEEVVYP